MKTMQDYEIRCTPEQTKRAYKLGAPITLIHANHQGSVFDGMMMIGDDLFHIPTAEQLRGWLREKGYIVRQVVYQHQITCSSFNGLSIRVIGIGDDYNEAVLEEIDAALDYLTSKSNNYDRD